MSFLDIVEAFSDLSQIASKKPGTSEPKMFIFFYVLLAGSFLWFVFELNAIFSLLSPLLFLGFVMVSGLIFTGAIIILIFRSGLIEFLSMRAFIVILLPTMLLTISSASFVNRKWEINAHESRVVIRELQHGAAISHVLVNLDGEELSIRIPGALGLSLQNGDSLSVQKKTGILGFDIIGHVRAP